MCDEQKKLRWFELFATEIFIALQALFRGTAVMQWLRCCATNRKVAGSIPDGVIGVFLLTEMGTRSISRCKKRPVHKTDNLTTILGQCHVIWEIKLPGTLWEPRGCNGTDLLSLLLTLMVLN